MKPTRNHESGWLVSFFILFYRLASKVKAKFSAVSKSQSLYFSRNIFHGIHNIHA